MPHASLSARRAWLSKRANTLKHQLISTLGSSCTECGSTTDLEINHLYQRTWRARRLTHYRRILRYWSEYHLGLKLGVPLIDCRCPACNKLYQPLPLSELEAAKAAVQCAAAKEQPF